MKKKSYVVVHNYTVHVVGISGVCASESTERREMKSSLIPHAFHIGSPRCRPTERRWIVSWMNIERAQRSKARERRVFLFLQPMSWRVMSVWNCVYTIFSVVRYLLSLIHTDGSLFFVAQTDVALRFALLAASGSHFHFSNEWENLCIEARKTLEIRGMNEHKRRQRRYVSYRHNGANVLRTRLTFLSNTRCILVIAQVKMWKIY